MSCFHDGNLRHLVYQSMHIVIQQNIFFKLKLFKLTNFFQETMVSWASIVSEIFSHKVNNVKYLCAFLMTFIALASGTGT